MRCWEKEVNGGRGAGGRGRKEGRKKRGTQNPLSRWKPRLPKPLPLAGAPLPLREFSSHRECPGFLGGPYFLEQW